MKQYLILTTEIMDADEAEKQRMYKDYEAETEPAEFYIDVKIIDYWYTNGDSQTKITFNCSNDSVVVKESPELIKLLIEYLIQHKDMVFISKEIYKKAIINNEKLQNTVAGKILNKITDNNY